METVAPLENPIILTDESRDKVLTLIKASHRDPMNLESVLPWQNGIDFEKPPKIERGCWIYATPYWDALDAAQRRELLWKEIARDVSMFIWLEQALPPLYIGYINRFPFGLSPEVYEYLMIFSREEITHTLMFQRYLKMAGLALFRPPTGAYAAFVSQLPSMHPVVGILWTLMIEWTAELNVMCLTQDVSIEPLTRKMFLEHHIEEVRHIAFGKRVVESFFNVAPLCQLDTIRASIGPAFQNLKREVTYNREVALHTSFVFPIAAGDDEKISAIRDSSNNQHLNSERFDEINRWFLQLGIV